MPVCEVDFRVGGTYRYRWRSEDEDNEFGFVGTYKEIVPNRKIVHTERYDEDESWGESINSLDFEPVGEETLITYTMSFPTAEARKAATDTGMTDGMEVSYKQLDDLLKTEAAR
jgi:uncharacterized protein YndB with AHSA1/START domain